MQTRSLVLAAAVALTAPRAHAQDGDEAKSIGRIFHSTVWTGKDVLVWGGGSEGKFFNHGLRISADGKTREAIASAGAPAGRWAHAGVWTGTELLVWGGRSRFESDDHRADGGRYDPATDRWRATSAENAPNPRSQMAAVWTGEELIVWGGYGNGGAAWNTGGRYNPRTDRWTPLPVEGAPAARVEPLSVWTGTELLVWGGITPDLKRTFGDGARYNPATNRWTPIRGDERAPAVWGATAVWTGTEMIVWGGSYRNGDDEVNQTTRRGAAYDPARDRWRPINSDRSPPARFFHTAVWTGTRMVVWGGGDQGDADNPPTHYDDGGAYDPATNRWSVLRWDDRPTGRGLHGAVWTGRGMMIVGGSTGGFNAFSDSTLWEPN